MREAVFPAIMTVRRPLQTQDGLWSITLPKNSFAIILIIKKISLILHPPKAFRALKKTS